MPCNIKVHLLIYFANAPNDFGHDKKINFNHVIRQTRAVHDDIFLFPLTTMTIYNVRYKYLIRMQIFGN